MTSTEYYQFSQLQLPPHGYHSLKKSWLSYVRLQLEDEGKPSYLPCIGRSGSKRSCFCNKNSISYPHWPPSSYEESIDQLFILLLYPCPSRPTLAFCWLSFLQKDLVKPVKDNESMLSLVQNSCPIFSSGWSSEEPTQSQLGEEMIAPISVNPYCRKELAIVLIIVKNAQHIAS